MDKQETIFNSWNSDGFKEKVVNNTNQLYFGASLGVGYQGNIGKGFGYDAYGKFMWTHQNGTHADINGEQIDFHSIDYPKTKLGAKINYANEKLTAFLGLSWEKNFNKKASAKTNGAFLTETSAFIGNTGIFELGASFRPQKN